LKLPGALLSSLSEVKGFNKEAFEEVHESGEQVTSIRLNPKKIKSSSNIVFPGAVALSRVPWTSQGYYLDRRPSFTADPLLHAGAYYVQEASSMFIEEVLKQAADLSAPLKVLDLCAAPGGKSTLVQSLISEASLLVSNEVIKTRVNILAENIIKWGAPNVIVTNNDPRDFQRLDEYFDVIVVDAPCSGSGLFRKDPAAIAEWSEQSVQLCSLRQQRILSDILPSLKPGGLLMYSTCSYSVAEDEQVADWLIAENQLSGVALNIPAEWNIVETVSPVHKAWGYRFYPDQVRGEGFYIALFKKDGGRSEDENHRKKKDQKFKTKSEIIPAARMKNLSDYLANPAAFFYIMQNEEVIAMPLHLEKELSFIQSALYIKKAGFTLGTLVRNELIPDHQLAISGHAISFNTTELTKENALQYLRRQEMNHVFNFTGWGLVTFQQVPLGWVKVLTNRVNNYYPKDWRILNK
jgi:16S rRNA C967 or C1407 C5-methylase (RsmB/RsmF family)/NOL1/NOP2/fmu family ribosome biogenesis protein